MFHSHFTLILLDPIMNYASKVSVVVPEVKFLSVFAKV